MKIVSRLVFSISTLFLAASTASAADLPNVPEAERKYVVDTCTSLYKATSEENYRKCLQNHDDSFAKMPKFEGLDQESIKSVVDTCKVSMAFGADMFAECTSTHAGIAAKYKPADMSNVSEQDRKSAELFCLGEKNTNSIGFYNACIKSALKAIEDKSIARPDFAGLPNGGEQHVRAVCELRQFAGPSAYNDCLIKEAANVRANGLPEKKEQTIVETIESVKDAPAITSDTPAAPSSAPESEALPDVKLPADQKKATYSHALDRYLASGKFPAWNQSVFPAKPNYTLSTALSPDNLFSKVNKSVYIIVAGASIEDLKKLRNLSQGSAVAIAKDRLATNCHVVKGKPFVVAVQGKTIIPALVSSADMETDRCHLYVNPKSNINTVPGIRTYEELKVGERVYAVGAPSGLESTLSEGLISGKRSGGKINILQTSAPISPGSSGGGLFDVYGNFIGVTTFGVASKDGVGIGELNFAISAEDFWK